MKLTPIDARVIVLPEVEEIVTASGFIIPESARKKQRRGTVIAVGNDEDLQNLVQVGDLVLYGRYSGNELVYEKVEYLVLERADILAKLS